MGSEMCIRDSLISEGDIPTLQANIMPFSLRHNGEIDTRQFFAPTRRSETYMNEDVLTCHFRGLKLVGRPLEFENRTAYVINRSESVSQGENDCSNTSKLYVAVAKAKPITIFAHDTVPSSHDKWCLINEWNTIANIIHGER